MTSSSPPVTDLRRTRDLLAEGRTRSWIESAVDGDRIVRVVRGVYGAPGGEVSALRALFARLPPGAVLGFHSAARVYGFGEFPSTEVHVIVPAGVYRPRIAGVVAHEAVVPVTQIRVIDGVPCAPPARCAIDLARSVRRLDALPVLDASLRVGACTAEDLRAEVQLHAGLKGVRQARELVPLAHPGAECRQESQLRLVLIDGGLPAPTPQIWVCDRFDVPIYRIDMGYEERRIGIEYDGSSHLDRERLRNDRARLNWLAGRGWTMRTFTDRDLYRAPRQIVSVVRAVLT